LIAATLSGLSDRRTRRSNGAAFGSWELVVSLKGKHYTHIGIEALKKRGPWSCLRFDGHDISAAG